MKTASAAAILAFASLAMAAPAPAKRQASQSFVPSAAPAASSAAPVSAVPSSSAVPSAAPSSAPPQPSCIVQSVTNANTDQVKASIDQWNKDVLVVNSFLNAAPGLIASGDHTTLGTQASAALTNAQDEPCQLTTLTSTSDLGTNASPAFSCAASDLMGGFGTKVLGNLQTIVNNPADTASVQDAVDAINLFRCCNVLGDASILWQDTAEDNGIANEVNTVAPLEDACANVSCANMCGLMDNGSFGTPGDVQIGGS